ncbi:MAG: dipeptide epimerase [Aminobacterium sp.]|jgi:o-succinylbenzoate synthase|nr:MULTISPECIES: dipeptide epimerase [unclassified Aminobacterium]MDD3425481.1 dipeptide epimerase [Aminobacterium sp.]MDD3706830.1 dipeptide epimerase [Aminobacterium sp.]MEA4877765.1 dipeptide epimerase [Aminobacterium sp.]WMI71095.1 dipeptide epimerase [Aminobacterium sp. MB27-C1]
MKIVSIQTGNMSLPLKKPFKTAVRSVNSINDVVVKIETDAGVVGYGEAPPTGKITGDTTGAILGAINDHIRPSLIGKDAEDLEGNLQALHECIIGNTSAKAALDMALFDIWGKSLHAPLYRLFGGNKKSIETDVTISVNEADEMAKDAINAVNGGYKILKIKVGKETEKDFDRIRAIREAIGYDVKIRIDANQGWQPSEAVRILTRMEDAGFDIELVEQPVKAHDLGGMAYVTASTYIPVVADESAWSPEDALEILKRKAADMINIKLMKCGGLSNAIKIIAISEIFGAEVMLGSMLEGQISASAAVHLALAKSNITRIDIDGPLLCSSLLDVGDARFIGPEIVLGEDAGLGITNVPGTQWN